MKCSVCGKRFILRKKRVYLVKVHVGFLTSPQQFGTFEATDCPRCGCQMVLNCRETELVQDAENGEKA